MAPPCHDLQTVLAADFPQHVIGMYFPTIDGTIIGEEPNADGAFDYLYSPRENIQSIGLESCGAGTEDEPFRSKAEADRFQKATGKRYKKGDPVHYRFKKAVETHWKWYHYTDVTQTVYVCSLMPSASSLISSM